MFGVTTYVQPSGGTARPGGVSLAETRLPTLGNGMVERVALEGPSGRGWSGVR